MGSESFLPFRVSEVEFNNVNERRIDDSLLSRFPYK